MDRIFLIGFMGTGKSTVSRELASLLEWEAEELDHTIEETNGMTIPELFAEKGEIFFRQQETDLLKATGEKVHLVVSCGGGIVLKEENVRWMKENGVVVLLTATPETVYQRVKERKNRPLLKNRMSVDGLRELKESREPFYSAAAMVQVSTDDQSVMDIAREIIDKIKQMDKQGRNA